MHKQIAKVENKWIRHLNKMCRRERGRDRMSQTLHQPIITVCVASADMQRSLKLNAKVINNVH